MKTVACRTLTVLVVIAVSIVIGLLIDKAMANLAYQQVNGSNPPW